MIMRKNHMILHDIGQTPMLGEVGIPNLTPRQIEVVRSLVSGNSDKQTGLLLSISRETVRRHINNVCIKLSLRNRTQLIVAFAQWQVTEGKEQ
jgi:DNA-binding CsgD family transcriptional regulator